MAAARRPLVMPKLGLTMTEGMVTEWVVAEGARFSANDVLLVVESDKVAHEIEAPSPGKLIQILVPEGETVDVSAELGIWDLDDGDAETATNEQVSKPVPDRLRNSSALRTSSGVEQDTLLNRLEDVGLASKPTPDKRRVDKFVRASPLARRTAYEREVALSEVTGTGPRGRVTAEDIDAHATPALAAALPRTGNRIKATASARTVAAKLTAAKRDTPHFYVSVDVEVSALQSLRGSFNALKGRPRISTTHLLMIAIAQALREAPHMNRVWSDGEIVTYDSIDVGIAIDTDRGLVSPVVRDLKTSAIQESVKKINDVIERARAGRLKASDMDGCAITLSNAGMHDLRYMSSIIPPGQSAILATGSIQQCFRPDEFGAPALRREMGIVLSADHRIHTGISALNFLDALRRAVANPINLVLEA